VHAARGTSPGPGEPDGPSPQDRAEARSRRSRALVLFGVVAVLGYAVDLGTKTLAAARLGDRSPVHVVGGLLQLTLTRNPGAAFSTGTSYTLVLSLVAIVAAGAVLFYARRLRSRVWAVGLGLLLAGVCGNLTDRVFREPGFLRGHVVDFIELPHWPIFNVADMCINVAAALIVIQAVRGVSVTGERS